MLRFAVASDGHFGQPDTPYEMYHRQIIDWLNQEHEKQPLELCIFNGDLIHDDPQYIEPVKSYYDQLQFPYYTTKGNHDQVSAERWKEVWGYEENHSFEQSGVAFLLGTTSNEQGEYLCANLEWLEAALDQHQSAEHIFVFLHISQQKWTKHGIDCPEAMKLIESRENVRATFHGHDHDIDGVMYSNSKPYFFDGHIGGSWGVPYRGFRVVDIFEDGRIEAYQMNPQVSPVVNQISVK